MPLKTSSAELFNCDIDLFTRFLRVVNDAAEDATEATFADHQGAAEVLGSGFEVIEGKDFEIVTVCLGEDVQGRSDGRGSGSTCF
jgi:hypothetical protein